MINKKKTKSIITSALIASALLFATVSPALADRLESDSYIILFGNFNVTSGEKSSANYKVTDTVGQTGAGPFGQYGSSSYFVGSGFQYIYQIDTFGFSISQTAVDLGDLTPGVHNTASHNLTISTRGAGGYTIYAYELFPLKHSNGTNTIPDTSCDSSCTISSAGVWTNENTAGFGFNVSGTDAAADFVDSTYYRPFADDSTGDPMQAIMTNTDIVKNETGTVTYKAGVIGTTPSGDYQTGIVYIAVPGY